MEATVQTPVAFGIDCPFEVPPATQHAVGSSCVFRYLSHASWKTITPPEYRNYLDSDIHVGLVFEDSANAALGGYENGKADATFAHQQAVDTLGNPLGPEATIFFAVDFDPAGVRGGAAATDAYFDGVAAVLGHVNAGVYGGIETINHVASRGFKSLWQTAAWSGSELSPQASAYQYSFNRSLGSHLVDFNHVYKESIFWSYKAPPTPDPDPYHYLWFFNGESNTLHWKNLKEREVIKRYDQMRKHPIVNRKPLKILRHQCAELAQVVYDRAHSRDIYARVQLPPTWHLYHRGWRYQQLIHRAQGRQFVK